MNEMQDMELCCAVRPEKSEQSMRRNKRARMPEEFKLAMSYVPFQELDKTYTDDEALKSGTLFPELDKPFMMGRCR